MTESPYTLLKDRYHLTFMQEVENTQKPGQTRQGEGQYWETWMDLQTHFTIIPTCYPCLVYLSIFLGRGKS